MKCANCGHENAPGAVFCDNCGANLTAPAQKGADAASVPQAAAAGNALICPQCGTPYAPGEAFCSNCGTQLPAPAPSAAASNAGQSAPVPAAADQSQAPASAPDAATSGPVPSEQASVVTVVPAPVPSSPDAAPTLVPMPSAPAPTQQNQSPAATRNAGTCPQCGHPVAPGQAFCDNCGASLAGVTPPAQAAPAASPTLPVTPPVPLPSGPRLIVASSGAQIPLPAGKPEYLIGREDPVSNIFPDVDMTPHGGDTGGVSRRHALLGWQNGQGWIEDLNSVNGTWVNKQRVPANQRQPLTPGSEIRLGRVMLRFEV